jgi:hypothetical protein
MWNYNLIGIEFQFYKMTSVTEMGGGAVTQHYECL